jgi:hypothetical protein
MEAPFEVRIGAQEPGLRGGCIIRQQIGNTSSALSASTDDWPVIGDTPQHGRFFRR